MTLVDFARLIRHRIKLIMLVALATALISLGAGAILLDREYQATSLVIASDPSGILDVSNLVSVVETLSDDAIDRSKFPNVSVVKGTGKNGITGDTIEVSAVAPTDQEAVDAANMAALAVADAATKYYGEVKKDTTSSDAPIMETPTGQEGIFAGGAVIVERPASVEEALQQCSFVVRKAISANDESVSLIKVVVLGLCIGFIIALCVVVVQDVIRRPIKGREDLAEVCDIPLWCSPANSHPYETLLANISFAQRNSRAGTVCLVPLRTGVSVHIAGYLDAALRNVPEVAHLGGSVESKAELDFPIGGATIVACSALADEVDALYASHRSAITVVCVEEWKDTKLELEETLEQLRVAEANLSGIALLSADQLR